MVLVQARPKLFTTLYHVLSFVILFLTIFSQLHEPLFHSVYGYVHLLAIRHCSILFYFYYHFIAQNEVLPCIYWLLFEPCASYKYHKFSCGLSYNTHHYNFLTAVNSFSHLCDMKATCYLCLLVQMIKTGCKNSEIFRHYNYRQYNINQKLRVKSKQDEKGFNHSWHINLIFPQCWFVFCRGRVSETTVKESLMQVPLLLQEDMSWRLNAEVQRIFILYSVYGRASAHVWSIRLFKSSTLCCWQFLQQGNTSPGAEIMSTHINMVGCGNEKLHAHLQDLSSPLCPQSPNSLVCANRLKSQTHFSPLAFYFIMISSVSSKKLKASQH